MRTKNKKIQHFGISPLIFVILLFICSDAIPSHFSVSALNCTGQISDKEKGLYQKIEFKIEVNWSDQQLSFENLSMLDLTQMGQLKYFYLAPTQLKGSSDLKIVGQNPVWDSRLKSHFVLEPLRFELTRQHDLLTEPSPNTAALHSFWTPVMNGGSSRLCAARIIKLNFKRNELTYTFFAKEFYSPKKTGRDSSKDISIKDLSYSIQYQSAFSCHSSLPDSTQLNITNEKDWKPDWTKYCLNESDSFE